MSHFWLSSTEKPCKCNSLNNEHWASNRRASTISDEFRKNKIQDLDFNVWTCVKSSGHIPNDFGDSFRLFLHYLYTKLKTLQPQLLLFSKVAERTPLPPRLRPSFETAKGFVLQDHQRSSKLSVCLDKWIHNDTHLSAWNVQPNQRCPKHSVCGNCSIQTSGTTQ